VEAHRETSDRRDPCASSTKIWEHDCDVAKKHLDFEQSTFFIGRRRNIVHTNVVDGFREPASALFTSRRDELELVAAAAAGQEQAFRILVERHSPRILTVTWRITRNREDARDVMQETFLKAFRYLNRFQAKSLFSTWLTRIAINEALIWLRKRRWAREVSTVVPTEDEKNTLEIADSSPTPETTYSQLERALLLSDAMKQLPPEVRRTIELRDIRGLSTEETARTLGVSVSAIKGRLFHGRKRLRQRLMSRLDANRCFSRHSTANITGDSLRYLTNSETFFKS
jgi:RNA polymerase sigma-70 factor, ECF subfamily